MKKIILVLTVLLVVGCESKPEVKDSYQTISVDKAKEMIDQNSDEIVLDVRSLEEYNEGHLPNSINMTNEQIKVRFEKEITDDKDRIIIVYCKSGVRAKTASQTLVDLGYKNVYTFGGITSWTYDIIE